ncbi:MAG: hypothetical protein VYE22_22630 [Myxococcota bacterium]|nr:hypothetical protein [Myxococcota bacterium]
MNDRVGWPTFAILLLFFAGFLYVVYRMSGREAPLDPGAHVGALDDPRGDGGSYRRHAWGPDAGGVFTGPRATRAADAGSPDPAEPGE